MGSIYDDVRRRGGVAKTWELLRDGHTSHSLTHAVRSGVVIRIRQGHYGVPELHPDEVAAYRVGGRLTGAAEARRYGIWAPAPRAVEVDVDPHARALRRPGDATRRLADHPHEARARWDATRRSGTRSLADAVSCVADVVRGADARTSFACVESALHLGYLTATRLDRELAAMPVHRRGSLSSAAGASESGGESLLRFELLRLGIEHRQQVEFAGIGRVDFMIGERLVIEVDGAEFHTSRATFEADRRRDALLAARGIRVLRFSYSQVAERWPEVEAALLAALA